MRLLAKWVMLGRLHAILIIVVTAMLSIFLSPLSLFKPIFTVVSAAAVGLFTLRKGAREGLLVFLGATLGVMLIGQLVQGTFAPFLGFALVFWLPVLLTGVVLRTTVSLAQTFEFTIILGVLAIGGLYLQVGDPVEMWRELLAAHLTSLLEETGLQANNIDQQQLVDLLPKIMTGLLAVGAILTLLSSQILARWWQSALYNPGGFGTEFRALRLHRSLAYMALVVMTGLALGATPEFLKDSLPLVGIAYILQGLAVLHGLSWSYKANRLWLAVFYLAIFLAYPLTFYLMLMLVLLGFTDTWLDFRNRFGGKK